ncbi:MAG TPA: porin [Psychromonas sp.]
MIKSISNKLTQITLLATALYAAGASADDFEAPIFSFSGFGTLGVVHSSEDQADFSSSIFKPNGAGYSHAWSFDVDSLIGGQVTANLSPKLSAVLQVIAEQNYDNSYRPHVEWANIKYQFTPDFSVRIGRIVMPSFMTSGYRKVGYAMPWVRPPLEVYGLVPISNNDGLDASYRLYSGEATNTIQAIYGKVDMTYDDGNKAEARQQWGIFNTTEYGPLTLRIGYHQTHLNIKAFHPFFNAFRQFGPEGIAIAEKYDCNGKLIPFATIGASYDPGQWFVMGEWARSVSHCAIGDSTAWYASGGYRLGDFTPYLTYSRSEADSNTSDPGLAVPAAAGLNAGLNSILGSIPVQQTVSLGVRWDFMRNTTLKLQYDHTDIGAGSPGVLSNIQPGFKPGGRVDLISAAMEFVF